MSMVTSNRTTKKWAGTQLPQFEGKKALILGGAFFGDVVRLFAEAGFERATTVEDADVVVFNGGVDVDPELYGASRHPRTQTPSKQRDEYEKAVYAEALDRDKIMFGICRGAQFLHVMNGGELWQDVEGHSGRDHEIYDCENDVFVTATSYHHQMLALNTTIDVLAVCKDQISHRFESDTMRLDIVKGDVEIEIEAGYYKETKCLFVQGHPEVGSPEYRSWSMSALKDFMDGHMFDTESPADDPDIESQIELWRAQQMMATM
jgi:gamma-glutamyl-gamma-aminobutyrate hydrolase PuuD